MQGQPERAIEQLRLAMERCIEGDIQVLFPSIARYLGAALIAAGEPNEAITLLEQAVARARLRGLGTFEVWCKAVLSEASRPRADCKARGPPQRKPWPRREHLVSSRWR